MVFVRKLGVGGCAALFTVVGIGVVLASNGGEMFNPGPLNGRTQARSADAKIRSHAALSQQCSACHVSPWSTQTMAGKCLDCHGAVREQIVAKSALHGRLPSATECMNCHTEHKGSHAEITRFHLFEHNATNFPLTGKHQNVTCTKCHPSGQYKLASSTCVSCHAEPKNHVVQQFGTNCIQCHTTETWHKESFVHRFPINHEGAMRKGGCAACHDPDQAKADYTCYNCHKHEKERTLQQHRKIAAVRNIDRCTDCHMNGKERGQRTSLDADKLSDWLASIGKP